MNTVFRCSTATMKVCTRFLSCKYRQYIKKFTFIRARIINVSKRKYLRSIYLNVNKILLPLLIFSDKNCRCANFSKLATTFMIQLHKLNHLPSYQFSGTPCNVLPCNVRRTGIKASLMAHSSVFDVATHISSCAR